MITNYVNLNISTSGATGASTDPLGYNEFLTSLTTSPSDNMTFLLKGSHTYDSPIQVEWDQTFTLSIDCWSTIPPCIKVSIAVADEGTDYQALLFDFPNLTLNRLLVELEIVSGNPASMATINCNGQDTPGTTVTITDVIASIKPSPGASVDGAVIGIVLRDFANPCYIKRCNVMNLGVNTIIAGSPMTAFYIYSDSGDGHTTNVTIDNCYIDGPFDNFIHVVGYAHIPYRTIVHYLYNAVYNCGNTWNGFAVVGDGAVNFFNDGGNIDNHGTTTAQLVNARQTITSLSLPADIFPISGSALLNVGDPALVSLVDIINNLPTGGVVTIGATELLAPVYSINVFNQQPLRNGVPVTSTIDFNNLFSMVNSDPYFDSTSKFARVDVFYTHTDNRQRKRLIHIGTTPNLQLDVAWSTYAKDGTWEKTKAVVYNFDGATHILTRNDLGTGQDLVLS